MKQNAIILSLAIFRAMMGKLKINTKNVPNYGMW